MSDPSTSTASEVTLNVKGPSEIKLTITIDLSSSVRDLKEAIHKQKEDVPADHQRLIYAGKVLKDEQPLSEYKLQNNHTIHLVKSAAARSSQPPATSSPTAARPAAAATSATASSPASGAGVPGASSSPTAANSASHGVPANFGAGQQFTNNPLAALNRADLAGPHMASIGRQMFQGTGMNPADPNMMMNAMDSPEFQQHMRNMLRRPEVIDQMIAMHPEMASMAPQMREMMQSDRFIDMVTNPESMRNMMQLQEAMGGRGGAGGLGGLGGLAGAFGGGQQQQQQQQWPPPGTFGTPGGSNDGNQEGGQGAGAGAGGAAAADPFAALRGLGGAGGGRGAFDPVLLQQIFGGGGAGAGAGGAGSPFAGGANGGNPFAALGALGGFGGAGGAGAQPADSRPPEERYATQLQTLRDMGFVDGQANLRALLMSGGSVEGAISILLG